jgi:AcrR family transcriptional regulator
MSAEETKEKILEAAIDEFSEFGYQKATIRNISKRAKVNLVAINYHFSSKKELYRNVLEVIFSGDDATTEMPSAKDIDSREKLEMLLREWTEIFMTRLIRSSQEENQRKYRICVHEMFFPSDIFDEVANKYIRKDIEPLINIISKGNSKNAGRKKILIKTFSVLGRCFFYHLHGRLIKNLAKEENFSKKNLKMIINEIVEETIIGLEYSE